MSRSLNLPGINIQHPWSDLIITGKKTIETRNYPIPKHYLNVDMALIQTPGDQKNILPAIIGIIRFTGCKQYKSKQEWQRDQNKHLVTKTDKTYAYKGDVSKWAWTVKVISAFDSPQRPPKRRGIKFTKVCKVKV